MEKEKQKQKKKQTCRTSMLSWRNETTTFPSNPFAAWVGESTELTSKSTFSPVVSWWKLPPTFLVFFAFL